jgi:hypothetical protein
MFGLQAFTVWRSFTTEIDHPIVRSFAHRYVFTSSAELFIFIVIAAVLTALVWTRRSTLSAAGLCILFGFAVWRYFFAGMSVFFRPPLGDGSWAQAFAGYLRINANFLAVRIIQLLLLFALLVLWPISFRRLYALNRNV